MKVTKSKRFAFQLVPRVRRIGEIGGGLLLTPKAKECTEKKETFVKRMGDRSANCYPSLTSQLADLLPTPTSDTDRVEALAATGAQTIHSCKNGELRPNGLTDAINFHAMLLHTPAAKEPGVKAERLQTKNGQPAQIGQRAYDKHNGRLAQVGLSQQLQMLPTPKAQNANSAGLHGQGGMDLQTTLSMLPTTATRDYKGTNSDEHLSKDRGHHDQLPNALKMNTGLKLQPAFAFWMMGYPEDWTLLPFLQSHNTPPENGEKNPSKPPETP
jgi:hypothetical protein